MDNQVEVVEKKKKLYQRWWFWVIIAVCSILIIAVVSDDDFQEGYEAGIEDGSKDDSEENDQNDKVVDEQSYKAGCKKYTYDELARNPDDYKNKSVMFTGKVIQVLENKNEIVLRVNVTVNEYGFYEDTIYVTYTRKSGEGRILEDDIITIFGDFKGLKTYTSVFNSSITIPSIEAKYIVCNQ